MIKISKILVSGGAGFIGNNLVKRLLENQHEVIIFDNGFRRGFENLKQIEKKITPIDGNVTNLKDWEKIPKDIELVFHLSAINGTKYFYEIPEKVIDVNVLGTLNFFKWLSATECKRVFFASSSEVYGFPRIFPTPETEPLSIPDPKNPRFSYASSKIIGEIITINFSKKYNIDYTIGRFHNVYGPNMGFEHVMPELIKKCVKREKFTIKGTGKETRSFCYIDDAIDAIMLLSDNIHAKNEIFNIGTSEEVSINNLVSLLEKFDGGKIEPVKEEFYNSGTSRRLPDISKINNLGFIPKISLEKGFKKTYDWYKKYYDSH